MIIANVLVPLLNANEPEAKLVGIHLKDGLFIEKGEIIFSLETTKATAEIEAPVSGYLHLQADQYDIYEVGDLLAVITDSEEEVIWNKFKLDDQERINSLRITEPARLLAEKFGLDLKNLPKDQLITETFIIEMTKDLHNQLDNSFEINPERAILVYGGGGHAKTVMEMVKAANEFDIVGIIDDNIPTGTIILGVPVLGTRMLLEKLKEKGVHFATNGVGGIRDIQIRVKLFELFEKYTFIMPKLVHPRAFLEESSVVENGVQVFANAYIGSEAKLQSYCMVNTNAVVSHDCVIGCYSHIAPGALLAGHVEVGEKTLVGMGVTTAIGIKIGSNVRIGNGAIIYSDVPTKSIIPAGTIWAGKGKN